MVKVLKSLREMNGDVNMKICKDKNHEIDSFLFNGSGDGCNSVSKHISNKFYGNLSVLCLSGQGLDVIGIDLRGLENVIEIDLSHNKLSELPSSIACLKKVNKLNLSHNVFKDPPCCIYSSFYFLSYLDLSFNKIAQFNSPPACIAFLMNLNLRGNSLLLPPAWLVSELSSNLECLDLSLNPCFKMPLPSTYFDLIGVRVLSNIKTLKICNTFMSMMNFAFLNNFSHLQCLELGKLPGTTDSKYDNAGQFVGELNVNSLCNAPLEELNAVSCGISDLPSNINKLVHLRVLSIKGNKILWLPDAICSLQSLVVFEASFCSLIMLPTDFGALTALQQLWISNNQLPGLPESFYSLTSLEMLDLYNNNFDSVPNISSLTSLKGFDICMNNCGPPDLGSDFKYECLRDSLRCTLTHHEMRSDARKDPPPPLPDDEDSSSRISFDDISEYSAHSLPLERCYSRNSYEDEIWDVNGDNHDNFDPNDPLPRWDSCDSVHRIKMAQMYNEHYFQPYVEKFEFNGTAVLDPSSDVEGQFDDAEIV